MKRNFLIAICGLLAATACYAQMSGNNMLFTPTVNLSAMTPNTSAGNYGGVFLTSNNTWPRVNWLGYADPTGQGLANSHEVVLWYVGGQGGSTVSKVVQATVPAGTAAPLYNGYRWVEVDDTGLWYGSWYTISALTDGTDLWGDLISNSAATQINWDADFIGNNGGWSRAGRWDSAASWPNSPGTQDSTTDGIFPVANVGYGLPIPEPASASIIGFGLAIIWALRRRS